MHKQCLAFACSWLKWRLMSAIWVFALSTRIKVALKAPAIVQRHMFCITESLLIDINFLILFGVCHTVNLYFIAGQTTAVYTCLALVKKAPQLKVKIFVKAIDCLIIFCCVFCRYGSHFNLVLIWNPSTHICNFGPITLISIMMMADKSNFLKLQDKWISLYLCEAKLRHVDWHIFCILCEQFPKFYNFSPSFYMLAHWYCL